MTKAGFTFSIPEWRGTAVNVGELWRLAEGRHTAVCEVFNQVAAYQARLRRQRGPSLPRAICVGTTLRREPASLYASG